MFLADTSPPAQNGTSPYPQDLVAAARAQMAQLDAQEKMARFAVLGYCNNPGGYASQGVNLVADAGAAPLQYSMTGNSTADVSPSLVDNPPGVTVPNLNSSGYASIVKDRVQYPLTTNQPQAVPVIPVRRGRPTVGPRIPDSLRGGRTKTVWSGSAGNVQATSGLQQQLPIPSDTAPPWQDALSSIAPASPAQNALSFLSRYPWLAIGGGLLLIGVLSDKPARRNPRRKR